uniref:Transposable element P transposase n=1 Tax=Schizaphis graminum TaxID=13262 RepID=A0A2S2PE83_SCHGA
MVCSWHNFIGSTRRLTQDCIESLFSVIRAKGGNNVAPDSSKFYSAIQMCVAQQLLVPPTLAYEIDSTFDDNLSAMNIAFIQLELHEENSIAYIAGWACSKLNHLECLDKLAFFFKKIDAQVQID